MQGGEKGKWGERWRWRTLSDERCGRSGSGGWGKRLGQHCGLCGRAGAGGGVSLDFELPVRTDGDLGRSLGKCTAARGEEPGPADPFHPMIQLGG
ncbi:unnamed protein product [Ectocarpus sp. 6 AP-2014]